MHLRSGLHARALIRAIPTGSVEGAKVLLAPFDLRIDVHEIGKLGIDARIGGNARIVARLVESQFVDKESTAVGLIFTAVAQADTQLLDRLHRRAAAHPINRSHPIAHRTSAVVLLKCELPHQWIEAGRSQGVELCLL